MQDFAPVTSKQNENTPEKASLCIFHKLKTKEVRSDGYYWKQSCPQTDVIDPQL